eukprot:1546068-Alexandrium_andersonii.AAC.1
MFSEAAAEALQAFASVAPWPITYIKTAAGGVDEICSPSAFGFAAGKACLDCEKGLLACLKVRYSGRRSL